MVKPPIARRKTANPGHRARRLIAGTGRLPPTVRAGRPGAPGRRLAAGATGWSVVGGTSMRLAFPLDGRGTQIRRRLQDHGSVTFPCLEWLGCRAAERREHDRQTSHPATAVKKTRAEPPAERF